MSRPAASRCSPTRSTSPTRGSSSPAAESTRRASRGSASPVRRLLVFQHDRYASADLQAGKLRIVRRDEKKGGIAEDEAAFDDRDELRAEIATFIDAAAGGGA